MGMLIDERTEYGISESLAGISKAEDYSIDTDFRMGSVRVDYRVYSSEAIWIVQCDIHCCGHVWCRAHDFVATIRILPLPQLWN